MKNKIYCSQCDDFVTYEVEEKKEKHNILNQEEIEIEARIAVCEECGSELFNEELEKENQNKAFNKYREKKNILSIEEIKDIRDKYNLTQKEMSRLLGWGDITYHRYENGCLPDETHNNQLKLISHPSNVKILLKDDPEKLSKETIKELNERIEEMLDNKNKLKVNLPSELYKKIKIKAEKDGMSISEYAIFLITKEYSEENAKDETEKLKREIKEAVLRSRISSNAVWSKEDIPQDLIKGKISSVRNYEVRKVNSH